jgi:hypothetical protein
LHLFFEGCDIHVLFQQRAQGLDIFAVYQLHIKTQAPGIHVLQVDVQFEHIALGDLNEEGKGFVVLGVPDFRLVCRRPGPPANLFQRG